MSNRSTTWLFAAAAALWCCGGMPESPAAANSTATPAGRSSTPTLTANAAAQVSLTITVCAGASGLPAGFTLQWTSADVYDAAGGQWPAMPSTAVFTGDAQLVRFALEPFACAPVTVGDALFDQTVGAGAARPLACGTEYVLRAFGNASPDQPASEFTGNLFASTDACGHDVRCTHAYSYWREHGPVPVDATGYIWPEPVKRAGLALGARTYDARQLSAILDRPAAGRALVALAHQLIAVKLNAANGANTAAIATAIQAADLMIDRLVIPPHGDGQLASGEASLLTMTLAGYNEGELGPGNCGVSTAAVSGGLP